MELEADQCNYLEKTYPCSKHMLKKHVAARLKCNKIVCYFWSEFEIHKCLRIGKFFLSQCVSSI